MVYRFWKDISNNDIAFDRGFVKIDNEIDF